MFKFIILWCYIHNIVQNWISTCKRMELDPYLMPCAQMNSKWTPDFFL